MKLDNQRGAALPIVLALMILLFSLLAGLMPMMADEARMSTYNTKMVVARYAAEAGAKYAANLVQQSLDKGIVPTNTVSRSNMKLSAGSPVTVSFTHRPDNSTHPTMIQIRATGTYNGVSSHASINMYLSSSPVRYHGGVVDLINTGKYSHKSHNPTAGVDDEVRWTITKGDVEKGIPDMANASGVSQVMFNNAAEGDYIDVKYRASASRDGKSVSGGGYGIYYGMIGNADNMNAYVLQYDPGARYDKSKKYSNKEYYASKGTLLVKKVVFEPDVYANSSNINNKFKKNTGQSPGLQEKNCWGYDSGGDSNYYALPFQEAKTGEVLRVPLASEDDSAVNGISLQTRMEQYTGKPFDIDAPHTIRIKTEEIDGKIWHFIYCDDNPEPILKFYDHSDENKDKNNGAKGYVLNGKNGKTFKGTCTGVRIWSDEVRVNFSNEITEDGTEIVSKSLVWID